MIKKVFIGILAVSLPDIQDTLSPELTEGEKVRSNTFADISSQAPYRDAVCCAAHWGNLMGVEDDFFDPEGLVTNAMAATVLGRVVGSDTTLWEFYGRRG